MLQRKEVNPMQNQKTVPFMITLPVQVRDQLRAIAAKKNLENLDQVTSAAEIARDVICMALSEMLNKNITHLSQQFKD